MTLDRSAPVGNILGTPKRRPPLGRLWAFPFHGLWT